MPPTAIEWRNALHQPFPEEYVRETDIPGELRQLYYVGPRSETYMFWGIPRGSALALYQMPAGDIIYHTVAEGQQAIVTRFQMVNTGDEPVSVSLRFGTDPINAPRVQEDFVVPALGEYDLSSEETVLAGEGMAFLADKDRALIVAISGHLQAAG